MSGVSSQHIGLLKASGRITSTSTVTCVLKYEALAQITCWPSPSSSQARKANAETLTPLIKRWAGAFAYTASDFLAALRGSSLNSNSNSNVASPGGQQEGPPAKRPRKGTAGGGGGGGGGGREGGGKVPDGTAVLVLQLLFASLESGATCYTAIVQDTAAGEGFWKAGVAVWGRGKGRLGVWMGAS